MLLGPPTASTGDAENITDTSADLSATINLHGEAGGFHFLYGTSPDALSNSTDVAAAGVVSSDTSETETLSGLTPDTAYYYLAAADNATSSTAGTNVQSFKTLPGPPVIQNVSVDSITDTTATVHFSINPQGSDTTYLVEYGPDPNDYAQQTQPVDVGSAPGFIDKTVDLTGLDPGSTVHFDIVASNDIQQNVDSGDNSFNTLQQVTGVAGLPVTVTDSGITDGDCPSAADTTVDWGDDSSDNSSQIECQGGGEDETEYTLTDTHTYASTGHYVIQIEYGDLDMTTDEYAEIFPAVVNAGLPMISGTAQQGQTLTTTSGVWNGDPSSFEYQWLDCDQDGQNCSSTGDDDPSYTLTVDDVGHTIEVSVTAGNGGGDAQATSSPIGQVQPSAPKNADLPAITGAAQQGQTLTTTNGTWDGTPTGFAYQWQDCDASGQNCTNTGTGANTYTLGANDVGHTIDVLVNATNSGGHTQVASNRTAVVLAPSAPPATKPVTAYGRRRHRPDGEHHERRLLGLGDPERASHAGVLRVRPRPEVFRRRSGRLRRDDAGAVGGVRLLDPRGRPGRGRRSSPQRAVPRAAGRDQQRRHDARTRRHVHHRRRASARRPDRRQDGERNPGQRLRADQDRRQVRAAHGPGTDSLGLADRRTPRLTRADHLNRTAGQDPARRLRWGDLQAHPGALGRQQGPGYADAPRGSVQGSALVCDLQEAQGRRRVGGRGLEQGVAVASRERAR